MGKIYDKIKSKSAVKLSDKMAVITPNGVEEFDSMDSLREQVQASLIQGAEAIIADMSPMNVDLTLLDEATFQPDDYIVGGKKFKIDIHCNNRASAAIARNTKRNILSVIQIWNGNQSLLAVFDAETLANARLDYRDELVIKENDILSQTVAALRLHSQNPAIHHIAMFLAYGDGEDENGRKEMDALGIYRVWD